MLPETTGRSHVVIIQKWETPKGISIKKSEDTICIPISRTHFIKPRECRQITLPWKLKIDGSVTITSAVSIRGTLSSVVVETQGGIKVTIYNTTDEVLCVPARTAGVRIFGVESHEVKKLPNSAEVQVSEGCVESVQTVKKTVLGKNPQEIKKNLLRLFPSVFDLTKHPITAAMKALMVKETELPMPKRRPVGGSQVTYNVDQAVKHEDIQRTLNLYEQRGYIEKVRINLPVFLSPLQPFRKPNKSELRIVNDFRTLNGYFPTTGRTQIDVRRVISRIPSSWRFFSILDLKEGFFSVPLQSSLKPLFGFHYNGQNWVYRRLPQGFSFSPILFSDRVSHIIAGTEALNFADDVIVGGHTPEEHNQRLFQVLQRFSKFGLKMNPAKMQLFQQRVTYLRYTLEKGTWTLEPYLKEKFEQLGEVDSRRSLERHIGILSFARTHILGTECILRSLRTLLKRVKERKFGQLEWNHVTKAVHDAYSKCLGNTVSLYLPNHCFTQYDLYTDWTDYHIGYMLFGYDSAGKQRCLLDVGSYVMSMATGSFLGEMKGIVKALKETRSIRGRVSTRVFSDNEAVVNKLKSGRMCEEDVRVCRCWEYLMHNEPQTQYIYIPGTENAGADGLSRLKLKSKKTVQTLTVCPIQTSLRPNDSEVERRLQLAHFGHWSTEVTMQNAIMEFGRWHNMRDDVNSFVKRCPNCAFSAHPQHRDLPNVTISRRVGSKIHLDHAGPFFDGSYVLVIIDEASRFIQGTRVGTTATTPAIQALQRWMTRLGPISLLCADNASTWNAVSFNDWAEQHGIQVRLNPSHYHQGNALVERAIQTMMHRMRRMMNGNQALWPSVVDAAIDAMNSSYHSAIGTCPRSLALGIDRNGVLIANDERQRLWQTAWQLQMESKEKELTRFQWKHQRLSKPIAIGMRVLLKDPLYQQKPLRKLSPTWTGPYTVMRRASRSVWVLSKAERNEPLFLAHGSQINPFYD